MTFAIPAQAGRRFVITGGGGGLGLATARTLALAGADVVLGVRDTGAAARAAASLGDRVTVAPLDLGDLDSVRRFADDWQGTIDVLVNNAGVANIPLQRTPQGFERQLGVNHLGHFALTTALLPHITDRVVTVASSAHRHAHLGLDDLDDLDWRRRRYTPGAAYAQSKLANLLFTLELQRRLTAAGSPVRAVAAHPGFARSNLNRHLGPVMSAVATVAGTLSGHDVATGARTILVAATADLPGGSYVGPSGAGERTGEPCLVGRSPAASSPELARRLWSLSEEAVGSHAPSVR